jgi:hypothetical protein
VPLAAPVRLVTAVTPVTPHRREIIGQASLTGTENHNPVFVEARQIGFGETDTSAANFEERQYHVGREAGSTKLVSSAFPPQCVRDLAEGFVPESTLTRSIIRHSFPVAHSLKLPIDQFLRGSLSANH